MTTRLVRILTAAMIAGAALTATPSPAPAANGDCGQPATNGQNPTASDALAILKFAVGQPIAGCTAEPCICDVNGNGTSTASDALQTLKTAVGSATVDCDCEEPTCNDNDICDAGETNANCPGDCPCNNNGTCDAGENVGNCPADCDAPPGLPCTSAELISSAGSDLDSGWTGLGHDADLIEGASVTFRTLRRCSNNQAVCTKDSECGAGTCEATCDCLPGGDPTCEVTGPTGQKYCLTDLKECNTNSDCVNAVSCLYTFGPPLPLSSGGNPVCVLTLFDGPLTGTANTDTGEAVTASNLKSRVFLGISLGQPCPRCGELGEDPEIGDTFTCDGGQFPGATCVVEGVSPDFGGVSRDCPPLLQANISGGGLAVRFSEVTTGTTEKTAQLPCSDFSFQNHPSLGNAKCTDNLAGPTCSSNADCQRCTGDPTTSCTSNAQCTGKGSCAAAPDQPVTCGYYCHCGFCNDNGSLPCFDSTQCPSGQACVVGTGNGQQPNSPQLQPNDCSNDGFICGMESEEQCANTFAGHCSLQDYRNCTEGSDTCENNNAGVCITDFRACFESEISRTGDPSPLGSYCRISRAACTNNGDCGGAGGTCEKDASVPETVALFCVPATSNSTINSAAGITGPGAVRLNSFVKVCRCGDAVEGCDEQCDDGNTNNGDGCSDLCQDE